MQNEIDKQFTAEQLAAVDAALTVLETFTLDWPVLSGEEKASLVKAPDDGRGWMEGMLVLAEQNLNELPRNFDPALVHHDLDLTPVLLPRQIRLQRVADRLGSALFMANSDAFAALLGVRRRLKDAGLAGVDDNLSEGLARFFNRESRSQPPTPPTPPPA